MIGSRTRLRASVPLLGAVVLLLVPLRAFFGSEVPVGRDLLFYFYPLKAHLAEAVSHAEVPWVDLFRWGGTPLLGSPSAAPFDPVNVFFLFLPLGAAMKAWILLHLILALAGFRAFARRLGLAPAPAAVAGLVFALSGTTVSLGAFPAALSALAALTWFGAFVFDLVRAPSRARVSKVAGVAALVVLATPPEFVFYALCVACAVWFAAKPESAGWRAASRVFLSLASAALLAAGLAAIAALPAAATAARSVRSPGGMGHAAAAAKPFAPKRLPEIFFDWVVADWSVVATAPGVPDYPYLPSVTPGRVAWLLVLAGLVRKGTGRIAAAGVAVLGVLLSLGDATPVFGAATLVLPPLGWIRYPEKHMLLAGFGLAWLAALGIARISSALSPRIARVVLPLLALAVLLDREGTTRRLSPVAAGSVLTRRPPLLESLPAGAPGVPPPRLFCRDLYAPAPVYDLRDLSGSNRVGQESLLPAYASLFGVGYQFEVDYDLSLSREAEEWSRLLSRAVPHTPELADRIVRSAGVAATVRSLRGGDGRYAPQLEKTRDALSPYRFAARVVASADASAVFRALLADGFADETAYVDEALPEFAKGAGRGRIVALADRASGLFLDVDVTGPAPAFLMLYRLKEAVEDATLDGRPVHVADLAFGFGGVAVPSGRHALRLRPDTRWVKIGAVTSALTAFFLAGFLVLPRRDAASPSA